MNVIDLVTGGATARIAPDAGGSLVAFIVGGVPVLRPTPDAAIAAADVRRTACYPLVPYSNRIRDARLRFAGREYALARNFGDHPHAFHGVGWQRRWSVVEATERRSRLFLHHDAAGENAQAWPWPFDAVQTFVLAEHGVQGDGAVLTMTLTLINIATEAFPFGLGWHPFFATRATTLLGFAARGVWRNDETQLPIEWTPVPEQSGFDPPRAPGLRAIDNVFTGFRGKATLADPARGLATLLEADSACAFVVVYAPPGSDFVAVEPVTHETDAFNRAAAGASRTGMRILPPGCAFSCTMRIAAARIR